MPVNTYSYRVDKNKYCSAHTQVKEMRCKDGTDTILIDTELMDMVEKLFAKLKCKKYIINSGYRTPSYDKKVGGNGKGQHTLGKAVDAKFYDQKGKIIPAQIVCCVAQDLGFKGIANINNKYQSVHLDTRTVGQYKGDEIYGTNSVTTDFYKYFNLTKANVAKYTGEVVENPVKYFPKYNGNDYRIADVLKGMGINNSFSYRSKIAKANNISGYRGTAAQNTQMLNLLKQGKLIQP